jgi:hypothetical protein
MLRMAPNELRARHIVTESRVMEYSEKTASLGVRKKELHALWMEWRALESMQMSL